MFGGVLLQQGETRGRVEGLNFSATPRVVGLVVVVALVLDNFW